MAGEVGLALDLDADHPPAGAKVGAGDFDPLEQRLGEQALEAPARQPLLPEQLTGDLASVLSDALVPGKRDLGGHEVGRGPIGGRRALRTEAGGEELVEDAVGRDPYPHRVEGLGQRRGGIGERLEPEAASQEVEPGASDHPLDAGHEEPLVGQRSDPAEEGTQPVPAPLAARRVGIDVELLDQRGAETRQLALLGGDDSTATRLGKSGGERRHPARAAALEAGAAGDVGGRRRQAGARHRIRPDRRPPLLAQRAGRGVAPGEAVEQRRDQPLAAVVRERREREHDARRRREELVEQEALLGVALRLDRQLEQHGARLAPHAVGQQRIVGDRAREGAATESDEVEALEGAGARRGDREQLDAAAGAAHGELRQRFGGTAEQLGDFVAAEPEVVRQVDGELARGRFEPATGRRRRRAARGRASPCRARIMAPTRPFSGKRPRPRSSSRAAAAQAASWARG